MFEELKLTEEEKIKYKSILKPYKKQLKKFHEYKGKNKKKRGRNNQKKYKINWSLFNIVSYIMDKHTEPKLPDFISGRFENFTDIKDISYGDKYNYEDVLKSKVEKEINNIINEPLNIHNSVLKFDISKEGK